MDRRRTFEDFFNCIEFKKGVNCIMCLALQKSLKIPKGLSESVYQRRTDNTMAKRLCFSGRRTFEDFFDMKNNDLQSYLRDAST
jgi:hypothetical protein